MDELRPPNPPLRLINTHRGIGVIFQCDVCGKECRERKSHFDKSKYHYCSRECFNEHKKLTFKGERNHQYGLKGDLNPTYKGGIVKKKNNTVEERLIHVGEWYAKPNEHGRIKEHRYVVELNHHFFDDKFFEEVNGWFYLKDGIEVHHIDFNHNNNDISNLRPMTKGEHVSLHNKHRMRKRGLNGKFIKDDTQ